MMKKLKKKQFKAHNVNDLIRALRDTESLFKDKFPNAHLDFNLINMFYKKFDTQSYRKMKEFSIILNQFLTIVQEFRSRGFSLIDIGDFENGTHSYRIIQNSFLEKGEDL